MPEVLVWSLAAVETV